MKIIFAGTPVFSVHTLAALINSPHEVIAVYTQPDRPAGRGRQLTASPVKQLAEKNNIPVFQPQTLRDTSEQQKLIDLKADVIIVVAYGLILPKIILTAPRLGCINVHASLLPRWRGAAPIQRAILSGDQETGVTIMQMDEGLDTGAMLKKVICPIKNDDTSATLHQTLAELGAEALLKTLADLDKMTPETQNHTDATYAHKITKEEAEINWEHQAKQISQQIRAFNPWPIAFFKIGEESVRVWQASVIEKNAGVPGEIMAIGKDGIEVATGENVLRLEKLQFPGGRILSVADILNAKTGFVVGKQIKES